MKVSELPISIFIATDFTAVECEGHIYLAVQHYHIIKRYHESFGNIVLCARTKQEKPDNKLIDASDIIGKIYGIASLKDVCKVGFINEIREDLGKCNLIVGRLHSIVACRVLAYAQKQGKKVLAEVMGDAWDAYWNHSLLGKIIAPYMYMKTKKVVRKADYALYVTEKFLEERYPCSGLQIAASNVKIDNVTEEVLLKRIKRIEECNLQNITIATTAAVDLKSKGQQYVVKAIPLLNRMGVKVKYLLIGDGDCNYLRGLAEKYEVASQIEFCGRLKLEDVLKTLEEVDIYVQPSLQEGLPRSVIEAMSRGCPCIGARTAGIPELVSENCVFKRKSEKAIALTIKSILNKQVLMSLAKENYESSQKFLDEVLSKKREDFYEQIKKDIRNG